MKNILIYGDSITWGRIPGATGRFDFTERFTGIIQSSLGSDYRIVEEGLRGRMIEGENPHFPYRDGLVQFGPIFGSHVPLDLVVIMLGTNDTNKAADKSPEEITNTVPKYLKIIEEWSASLLVNPPKVLIVSPPRIIEDNLGQDTMFINAERKTLQLPTEFERVATEHGCYFLDASTIDGSQEEGVHLDAQANKDLAEVLKNKIHQILNQPPI